MKLDPATAPRTLGFVELSLAAFLYPMVALSEWLTPGARLLGISSAYVLGAPPDFAHYVAAKGAIEGLLRAYAAEHPATTVILARPPRVRTDVTNTAFGAEDAIEAEAVAVRLVKALAVTDARATEIAGALVVVDDFGAAP